MASKKRLNVSLLPLLVVFGFFGLYSYIVRPIEDPKSVYIASVENKIKIGKLANNRNLAFGCKNIFEEVLQEKGFNMYFDVNRTKRNISVFHSDVEETLVTMKGTLTDKSGKKIKDAVAEESSSEISTSTLITDEGSDKINQQALSSAIKKTCESLINKVFFNKK
jgi:hypothetical protein